MKKGVIILVFLITLSAQGQGTYATQLGYGTNASGHSSLAVGYRTASTGSHSVALGRDTNATEIASTAT